MFPGQTHPSIPAAELARIVVSETDDVQREFHGVADGTHPIASYSLSGADAAKFSLTPLSGSDSTLTIQAGESLDFEMKIVYTVIVT